MGDPKEKTPDHPQEELGLCHMWPHPALPYPTPPAHRLERIILPGHQYCYQPDKKEVLFKTVMHAIVNHNG